MLLFTLILVVCSVDCSSRTRPPPAVRSRRRELGVLACLGWTRPTHLRRRARRAGAARAGGRSRGRGAVPAACRRAAPARFAPARAILASPSRAAVAPRGRGGRCSPPGWRRESRADSRDPATRAGRPAGPPPERSHGPRRRQRAPDAGPPAWSARSAWRSASAALTMLTAVTLRVPRKRSSALCSATPWRSRRAASTMSRSPRPSRSG